MVRRLSGFIFEWSVGNIERGSIDSCPCTKFMQTEEGSRWERFEYTSREALNGEEQYGDLGPYRYPIICRRSGPRIAILSVSRNVAEAFANRLSREVLAIRLEKMAIAVDAMVKLIVKRPTVYCVCYANARTPAFGTALRNVVFSGDDLGAINWFKDSTELMSFFLCGIRLSSGGTEIIRLGSDGRMSFQFGGPKILLQIEEVLHFLRTEKYLSREFF